MLKNEKKTSLFSKKHNKLKSNENINSNIINNIIYPSSKNKKLTDSKTLLKILEEYKQEIINIKQFSKFNEENYEEQIKLIKTQTTNFINENLELKSSIDKLKMDITYKEKEIDKFKSIIQNYQKLLNDENNTKILDNVLKEENNKENELIFESQIEKLKTDNLFILDDLKKEQAEHENTKKALEQSKENNSLLEKKLKKKNIKIIKLKKQIKELKKNINNNSIQNNDTSIISGSFSTPSKINLNTDNISNYFSNYSFNSNVNNTSGNENFLKHMNILLGQNNFLRKELQKAKNRIFECNVKMQIYESKEEENLKMRQKMESINDYINEVSTVTGKSSDYIYNDKTRFIEGKLSTTAVSFSAHTTAYTKKNGKKSLWLTRGLAVSDWGNKLSICETVYDYTAFLMPMQGKSKHRPNLPLCYVFVFETIHQIPNYIHPYDQLLGSSHQHSLSGTPIQLAL